MQPSLTSPQPGIPAFVANVTYQLAGFDRLNFVSDIADTVPQDGSYIIRALCFEGNGVQANGLLTVQILDEPNLLGFLAQRLRSVQGMVSVQEIQ
ncbi:hypothetical protein [Spirosoma pollinicola]|uniref:ACT domain-containing protein n=1 Tax=Spirosoma pollinicola TaxID=2057025 RepID=A0A2K8YS10_9BACT|nr:hypothetical protein [Spirosoma pollinicola]AUD00406.1 hypothetical protein CWM47_00370 [Spirosoma pollinicola]